MLSLRIYTICAYCSKCESDVFGTAFAHDVMRDA
jgi:hypothetical protein